MEGAPMLDTTTFVGLDVHARSIKAVSLDVMTGGVRAATFGYDAGAVAEWVRSVDPRARCVYESGVTGFDLQKRLSGLGVDCVVECRAVGLYHMVDEAGGDDKVLCVPADVRFDDIKDIDDVNEYHKAEIKHFFEQYKALEPGKEVLPGDYWTGADAAEKEIIAARQRLADSEK